MSSLPAFNDTLRARRRLSYLSYGLFGLGVILMIRLGDLQVVSHGKYKAQASQEHTRKYEVPARRGELYFRDGASGMVPAALDQQLNVLYADPHLITDKPAAARQLAAVMGASVADYEARLAKGIEYVELAQRVPNAVADQVRAKKIIGVGLVPRDYRTYPEGALAAQALGFVNSDGRGQYGIEAYLNDQLAGRAGGVGAKTDTQGLPIATADNQLKPAVDGSNYILTIDRNIQSMVERELAGQVKAVGAKGGSVIILDASSGAIRAMANYPSYDLNAYSKVTDYSLFSNKVVSSNFEPGSGIKTFTMAAGLNENKVTPDSTYNDPGCFKVDTRQVCNAASDKPGPGKTMTVVLRDSLNTGVMQVLRLLGGDPDKFTLIGKRVLYDYFTKRFGFGVTTGVEQAGEAAGRINPPSTASGNDVNYANMSFGQGMSVTMIQMVTAMQAIANGGRMLQPHLVDAELMPDGTTKTTTPKVVYPNVISPKAQADLSQMLQVVVQHGSGYLAGAANPGYKIAGKTGTAQIPKPDGTGYIEGANIGSFVGYAPADKPKFVMLVRIDEPSVSGYAESTTVPLFAGICKWLFQYYAIPPAP